MLGARWSWPLAPSTCNVSKKPGGSLKEAQLKFLLHWRHCCFKIPVAKTFNRAGLPDHFLCGRLQIQSTSNITGSMS